MDTVRRTKRTKRTKSPKRKSGYKPETVKSKEIPYEKLYPFIENTYYIRHDNIPFRVLLEDNVAYVDRDTFKYEEHPDWKEYKRFKYTKVFIGNDNDVYKGNPNYFGNSILLQISPQKYIFIGNEIFSFRSREQIEVFESPVRYPYAYTKTKTFLIWDKVYFPTIPDKDPAEAEFIHERDNKDRIKKIELKMIYEKVY
jgi:hypothetical protein